MKVTFWGVRGSIACPGSAHAYFGGNTSCVEVDAGGNTIILDAGTGLRPLGDALTTRGHSSTILLSHAHWDHTCGLPFFKPLYDPERSVRLVSAHVEAAPGRIRGILEAQISSPSFPISFPEMRAALSFVDIVAGSTFELAPGVNVRTAPLRHPGGASGYRIEHAGIAVAYVTDTEHDPSHLDERVVALAADADLVIYDSTYTDDELESHRGWGHSTWQEGIRICHAAGAKALAIFHHDPDHDDAFMRRVSKAAKASWSPAFVARETSSVDLARTTRSFKR